jgi:hypothetical protein
MAMRPGGHLGKSTITLELMAGSSKFLSSLGTSNKDT